jgi:predicted HTH transcriptional regulator
MRRVPEPNHRRFKTLRVGTQHLLEQGEQLNIEFKSEVPSNIANQAAAGANLVALDPSLEVYTILIGVEEEEMRNGARRGRVVGCRDADGNPLNLDQLRLQISQMIRDRVIPPPQLAIYEENTGTPRPILVLEIRPNEPPHRVADKYQVRGVGGLQPAAAGCACHLSQSACAGLDR